MWVCVCGGRLVSVTGQQQQPEPLCGPRGWEGPSSATFPCTPPRPPPAPSPWGPARTGILEVHIIAAVGATKPVGHDLQLHDLLADGHVGLGDVYLHLGVVDLIGQAIAHHLREVPGGRGQALSHRLLPGKGRFPGMPSHPLSSGPGAGRPETPLWPVGDHQEPTVVGCGGTEHGMCLWKLAQTLVWASRVLLWVRRWAWPCAHGTW